MYKLSLPAYDIKLLKIKGQIQVFDPLRSKYVALTPEEWVRQHFVHYLIHEKCYPKMFIANEVALNIGNKSLRADTVVYKKDLNPLMIIEYKAPYVELTKSVFEQALTYNTILKVDFLILSNGIKHLYCKINNDTHTYSFLKDIPEYE